MKVFAEIVPVLLLSVSAYHSCQSQEMLMNTAVDSECVIPNQVKTKGVCVTRKDCLEYEDLFNVTELLTDRLSFIINLDCGFDFDTWKSLVCCPKPGNSYKYVNSRGLETITKNIYCCTMSQVKGIMVGSGLSLD